MRGRFLLALCFLVLAFTSAQAQTLQVNRENRTISVTVSGQAKVDAELAYVSVGYSNYGPDQERAFQDNVTVANQVSEALLKAGVPSENIETQSVGLESVYDEDWPEQWKKERRYRARQRWIVVVPVEQAQTVVGVATASGANEVEDVRWAVRDEAALKAKAYSAALGMARTLAAQMAKEMDTKLGALLYASNTRPVTTFFGGLAGGAMSGTLGKRTMEPKLRLFPQKVEEEATVYATFAIE